MDLTREKLLEYQKRIMLSRLRILIEHGFYGLLLMHMILTIDEECDTAATDGTRLIFGPKFLDNITDSELDFIMMHEILHVALSHCFRGLDKDNYIFNIACDIVVNSNILKSNDMDFNSITLEKYGESMHLAPNKEEGFNYTAEEVYEMLIDKEENQGNGKSSKNKDSKSNNSNKNQNSNSNTNNQNDGESKGKSSGKNKGKEKGRSNDEGNSSSDKFSDDHSRWNKEDSKDSSLKDTWVQRTIEAAAAIQRQQELTGRGEIPKTIERLLKELKDPQIDWKVILDEFVQEVVSDYSFSPPDKRYDSPFFLPDFNDVEYEVSNILFMVDTSASINDNMLTSSFSEIKGAIDQFDGKLQGWLGFFDATVYEPIEFETVDELLKIKPIGGGGTDFEIIFNYVNENMIDNPPKSIIILTDGYAPFPKQEIANGIPVLWLINNKRVTPPWGKVARIIIDK